MGRVYRRAAARRDLIEHLVYLAETAGEATAERFLEAARTSFEDLAAEPSMGAPVKLRSPAPAGMRRRPVRDFRNYLIFCLPRPDGIAVVRVCHRPPGPGRPGRHRGPRL